MESISPQLGTRLTSLQAFEIDARNAGTDVEKRNSQIELTQVASRETLPNLNRSPIMWGYRSLIGQSRSSLWTEVAFDTERNPDDRSRLWSLLCRKCSRLELLFFHNACLSVVDISQLLWGNCHFTSAPSATFLSFLSKSFAGELDIWYVTSYHIVPFNTLMKSPISQWGIIEFISTNLICRRSDNRLQGSGPFVFLEDI